VTNSLEDYLETIYMLTQANGYARVRDVAASLHVKMPSVIKAVLELKRYGYVTQSLTANSISPLRERRPPV